MFELKRAGECTFYIEGITNIGVYQQSENEVYIVDTGWDDEYAKAVLKVLDKKGWKLKGILVTHAHEDHIGGNLYVQKKTGCPAYSIGPEAAITRYTDIEGLITYGGYPFKEIRNEGWTAKSSSCLDIDDPSFPKEVEVIKLHGHSIGHIGFRMPDGTCFLGDAIASKNTVEKYPIIYCVNIGGYIETLKKLKSLRGKYFVPSHAPLITSERDLRELADINIKAVEETGERIASFLVKPKNAEDLLKCVFDFYGMKMDEEKYVLVLSVLRSYISWLKDEKIIEGIVEDNMFLWRKIK